MSFRLQLGEVSVAAGETTSREPFLCRVATAPDLAYIRDRPAGPGKRSATGERRGNYAKMALQIASLTCCVEALPFMSGVFGPQAIVCSIAARMPS